MEAESEIAPCEISDLPRILYLPDLAAVLGRSPQAVKNAVSRGTLPRPRKVAGRACWLREDVMRFLAESPRCSRTERQVKITARPRKDRPGTMQVTFELPSVNGRRNRPRRDAPAGFTEAQAVAWGHSILKDVLREYMGPQKEETPKPQPNIQTPQVAPSAVMTMREFWQEHMQGDFLKRKAPGTRKAFQTTWTLYIEPVLGDLPLDRIGREEVRALRRRVQKLPAKASRNVVLGKVRTVLQYAVQLDIVDADDLPTIHPDQGGEPSKETPCYSPAQVDAMVAAATDLGAEYLAVLLLMVDACLRVSEVCALQWGDVDLNRATITVRHNLSDGQPWRPKRQKAGAKPKAVGMSPRLVAVLRGLKRRGLLVLMREGERQHTRATLRWMLRSVQLAAAVPVWSPHKLRHTGVTMLADGGAPMNLIKSQARHAHVSTTARYIHDVDDTADRAAAFLATLATNRPPPATDAQNTPYGPN